MGEEIGVSLNQFLKAFNATIIYSEKKGENGMSTISGKIKSKKVKNGTYGDLIVFQVGASTMSVFANDKKLTQEAKDLIRELQEGDEAEFTTYESTKDGKTYTNISGVIKVSRLDYGGDSPEPPAQEHKARKETPEVGKIVGTCTQYAILYANQKMATTGAVVPLDEVKEIACELVRFEAETIATWGE